MSYDNHYSFHNLYHAVLKKSTKKNDNVYNLNLEKKRYETLSSELKKLVDDIFNEFSVYAYYYVKWKNYPNEDYIYNLENKNPQELRDFILTHTNGNGENEGNNICECDIIILHCYIIKNKFNDKIVHPIGRVCILQFLPEPEKERLNTFFKFLLHTICQIKKNRIKEMTTEERIEFYKKENEKRKKEKKKKNKSNKKN